MRRILAVDDDPDILVLVSRILEEEGYEVVTAACGLDALEIFGSEPFDMVLLDVMMPEMDGYTVSHHLRMSGVPRTFPVVFLTAKDDAQTMQECFRAGGTIYLTKPFSRSKLVKTVRGILPGEAPTALAS